MPTLLVHRQGRRVLLRGGAGRCILKPYYEDAQVRIYHGDCMEIVPQLAGESIDLLLADPPYGIDYQPPKGQGRMCTMSGFRAIEGDDKPFDPAPWLGYPKVILWGGNHYASRLPDSPSWLYWDKRRAGIKPNDNADGELAWTNLGGPLRIFRLLWMGAIKEGSEKGSRRLHPNQKPIALMKWCIARARLKPGAMILDPYTGSGAALVAAKEEGHKAIGIDTDEEYCEIAANRLSQGVLW